MTKILHITGSMNMAGQETFIMNVFRNIDRKKFKFEFLLSAPEKTYYEDEIINLGGKIHRISPKPKENRIKRVVKRIRASKNFFENHRDYDCIHLHTCGVGNLIELYFAWKSGIPKRVIHSHNNSTLVRSKILFNILKKVSLLFATDLFACSKQAGYWLFGKKARFRVIPNAIDVKNYDFDMEIRNKMREEIGVGNKVAICNIGRFSEQKNQLFLIDVFKEIIKIDPNVKLYIVGDGELKSDIISRINKYQLESFVELLGLRKDVNRLLQAMDLFLFPSKYEGLGIVAVEAQASGLLTIVSDTLPKEVEITNLIKKISLNDDAEKWATDIVGYIRQYKRTGSNINDFKEKGYDITSLIKFLSTYYRS
ncbi:glycosyltransferase family 1 protein [Fictibacillus sp. NRS-1165]|uniref:glycosyltransferase family 1 protein n=1 Tax=Fictibacillus sp. NRS-1165 TaxID=3144463 RepID=UPI003D242E57